jgi:hypothetical protein
MSPYTDDEEPTRTKLRMERVLPKLRQSSTEMELAKRAKPQIEIPEPTRVMERMETELAIVV